MKTITQTLTKGHKEKTTVILCDKCKTEGRDTALETTGLSDVVVAKKGDAELFVSLMAYNEKGDLCADLDDSDTFREEFAGDWCQGCVREKLLKLLSAGKGG